MANSHGNVKCQRSAFASRSPPRVLAARFPHIDHVWITTNQLIRFHQNEFDEIPCKLAFIENLLRLRNTQPYFNYAIIMNTTCFKN